MIPHWIVNDWTGHIKAMSGNRFVRAVRGDTSYGINDFVDNGDGTVTDNATGLMWSQDDNGEAINWEDALAYAEDATIAGYDDWRLPNVKELQSIADYSGVFPAMDTSVFNLTEVTNVVYDSRLVMRSTRRSITRFTGRVRPIHILKRCRRGCDTDIRYVPAHLCLVPCFRL